MVPFPHISPTLDTKISNRIYAEVRAARCIWWLAFCMDERGSVTLKGEVHYLVQTIHSLSLIPCLTFRRYWSFLLSDVDINCTPQSTAVVQLTLKCKSIPYYVTAIRVWRNTDTVWLSPITDRPSVRLSTSYQKTLAHNSPVVTVCTNRKKHAKIIHNASLCLCVLCISQNKQPFSLYNINGLVFITEI